jgi:hypothetical protein
MLSLTAPDKRCAQRDQLFQPQQQADRRGTPTCSWI